MDAASLLAKVYLTLASYQANDIFPDRTYAERAQAYAEDDYRREVSFIDECTTPEGEHLTYEDWAAPVPHLFKYYNKIGHDWQNPETYREDGSVRDW